MSTRTNIHFNHGSEVHANIYRHSDGYPGKIVRGEATEYGVLADLLTFFRLLKAEVVDNRLRCAEYLAAKFLVWQAKEYATRYEGTVDGKAKYVDTHYLEFLGVAPCNEDHGDIEFVYEVDCDNLDKEGFPVVRWRHAVEGAKLKTMHLCGKPRKAS